MNEKEEFKQRDLTKKKDTRRKPALNQINCLYRLHETATLTLTRGKPHLTPIRFV